MEYSPEALAEAVAAYRGIEGFVLRASEFTGALGAGPDPAAGGAPRAGQDHPAVPDLRAGPAGAGAAPAPPAWPEEFAAALDDDLGVPQALAVLHATVREGNNALAAGDAEATAAALALARAMLGVLGLDPLAEPWASRGADDDLREVVHALVKGALAERQAAKERKDYAAADAIRDRLRAAGVLIEDTPDGGSRWELKR